MARKQFIGAHVQVPPTRSRPTQWERQRETLGQGEETRFPTPQDRTNSDVGGKLICAGCHAISLERRWFLDERQYEALKQDPETQVVVCPGCQQVERQMYDGEVILRGKSVWRNPEEKQAALNLIRNVETSLRLKNPLARLASVEDRGDEIYILTISPFLAHRLVKEFAKAHGGHFRIDNLPDERFVRASWDAAEETAEQSRKSERRGRRAA
jgi:hypothetical protein